MVTSHRPVAASESEPYLRRQAQPFTGMISLFVILIGGSGPISQESHRALYVVLHSALARQQIRKPDRWMAGPGRLRRGAGNFLKASLPAFRRPGDRVYSQAPASPVGRPPRRGQWSGARFPLVVNILTGAICATVIFSSEMTT
jgi:hypothetical protein